MKPFLPLITIALFVNYSIASYSQCPSPTAFTTLDINNVSAVMMNGGDNWWDMQGPGYEVPKGSNKHALFSSALWIGGLNQADTSQLHVAAQQHRMNGNDFFPGPIPDSGMSAPVCEAFDRFWVIYQTDIMDFLSGTDTAQDIWDWPAKGNPNFPVDLSDQIAPFYDANSDGAYNPIDGDYPAIKGDQAVFWVFNDQGNMHTETGGNAFGFEFHAMAYAFFSSDHINNTTFYEYTIINKSQNTYIDTYIGHFTDAGLGYGLDDYLGVNIDRKLGFMYNGDGFDETAAGYGANLPISGIRMHWSPDDQPMHNFTHMEPSFISTPSSAITYYNVLRGYNTVGMPRTDLNGDTTLFTFSGTPGGTGDAMCNSSLLPADYRMMQAYGAYTFEPGDIKGLGFSVIFVQDSAFNTNGCPDMDPFYSAADQIDVFYQEEKCANYNVTLGAEILDDQESQGIGSIDLDFNGTNSVQTYAWSNGENTRFIDSLTSGIYSVTVTNAFGCSATNSFDVGDLIGIDEHKASVEPLVIYPNPGQGTFTLKPAPQQNSLVEVYNTFGQQVMATRYNHGLDLSSLASGSYLVKTTHQSTKVMVMYP